MLNAELFESFEIELPEDEIRAAIFKGLEEIGQIKGFRSAANMPLSYLIRKVGEDFLKEIFAKVATRHVDLKLAEMKAEVAGNLQITGLWSQWDRPLKYRYRIEFERYPVFEVQGLDTLRINAPQPTIIDDAHIDTAIETLRRAHSRWTVVTRPATSGDRVTADFTGILEDGQGFPGGSANGVAIELGAGGMLPEFESGLIGISAGEMREIQVSFPENYQTAFLAGKQAIFRILALSIAQFDLIPMDDDFAKKIGAENVAHMREGMRTHLTKEHATQDKRDIGIDLLRQLHLANRGIQVPNELMAAQMQAHQMELSQRLGIPPDQVPIDDAAINEAYEKVQLSIIVRRFLLQEKLQIDDRRDFMEQVVEFLKWRARLINANPSRQE
jgi:trigger factor